MKKKLKNLSFTAFSNAILGVEDFRYYSDFGSGRMVPNWQKINNFNPKPIKHKRNKMKRRSIHL